MTRTFKLAAAAAAAIGLLPFPARAHMGTHPVTFPVSQTVPCGPGEAADVCAYNPPASELGYTECTNPFPPGSFYDIITEPAPDTPSGKHLVLQLETFPQIDWDTFICEYISPTNHNGQTLAKGANELAQPCDNLLGSNNLVPVGCTEVALAPAKTGKRYVLRAYNYSDIADLPGRYTWIAV